MEVQRHHRSRGSRLSCGVRFRLFGADGITTLVLQFSLLQHPNLRNFVAAIPSSLPFHPFGRPRLGTHIPYTHFFELATRAGAMAVAPDRVEERDCLR